MPGRHVTLVLCTCDGVLLGALPAFDVRILRLLSWAATVLSARGIAQLAAPQHVRIWNLSSIWRLPTDHGDAWLKVVPPFFAHEGALLPLLDPQQVPPVLGAHPAGCSSARCPASTSTRRRATPCWTWSAC